MRRLLEITKQSKPYDNPETALTIGLVVLVQRISDRINGVLKPADLSQPQYNALRILRGAGEGGRTCNEIAGRMIHRVPDVTRLLDRLEARGLILRKREDADRRVVRVWSTESGLALLATLDAPLSALNRDIFAGLGEKRVAQFSGLVEATLEVLTGDDDPPA